MYATLMQRGGFRVDILNPELLGAPDALGFYVRGELRGRMTYARQAKFHLYAGIVLIDRFIGRKNLAVVYIDVNSAYDLSRPGYQALKSDIRSGAIRKVFVYEQEDLLGCSAAMMDLADLFMEVDGFEILTVDNSGLALQLIKPVEYQNQTTGVPVCV